VATLTTAPVMCAGVFSRIRMFRISTSEKAFSSVSPQTESSVLGMGSLPHGLERMEPTQSRGLSRWESPWTQNATSSGDTDSASGK
ncbi:hypothetical protein M9458_004616, partial [Cirrhinus mrigala]